VSALEAAIREAFAVLNDPDISDSTARARARSKLRAALRAAGGRR
jgi:hypothetical protein